MTDWIIHAALSVIFFLWGYAQGKKSQPKAIKEKDLSICSCTHAYSMHKDDGACNVMKVKNDLYRYPCPCIRYDGIPPAHIYVKDA